MIENQYDIVLKSETKIIDNISFENFYVNHSAKRTVVVITDEHIYDLHAHKFQYVENLMVVEPGESCKDFETVEQALLTLQEFDVDKNSLIIGVGGGAITDFVGFLGSIYMRGIDFEFFPTTILGAVDASIGGKNGVNFHSIKNFVGTINQPKNIIIDYDFFSSLPVEAYQNGMAEVIKYGCISDSVLFEYLENIDLESVISDNNVLKTIINTCQNIKVKFIQEDVLDNGNRKLLNFGHTLGHAIEIIQEIPHGFAVAIGMVQAARISVKLGLLKKIEFEKIKNLLGRFGLPIDCITDWQSIEKLIRNDKKKSGNTISFVVLESIGQAKTQQISFEDLKYYYNNNHD